MDVVTPFVDIVGMTVWLAGFVMLYGVPGWLLVGRRLTGQDPVTRGTVAVSLGMLIVPVVCLVMSWMRVPVTPWTVVPVVVVGAWLLGRTAALADLGERIAGAIQPLSRWGQGATVLLVLVALTVLQRAFVDFAASPHLHDAGNHAFLTSRIAAAGSLDPSRLFAAPWGSPPQSYLVGWHVGAALLTRLCGTPAHVSAWYFAALAAGLLPLGLSLLWRAFRAGEATVLLAGALALGNYYVPTNLFAWGGYGQIVGLFLLPAVVVLLRALALRPTVTAGALCGVALVGLIHVHASEVFLVLVLAMAAWPRREGDRTPPWRALGVTAGVVLVAGILPLVPSLLEYGSFTGSLYRPESPGAAVAWREFLTAAGGNIGLYGWLVPLAILGGLAGPGRRRVAALSLVLAVLFFTLRTVQDPVTLLLTRPFYQLHPRVLYPQIYLAPLLVAALPAVCAGCGRRWYRQRHQVWACVGFAILVIWLVVIPGIRFSYRNLENKDRYAVFSAANLALAAEMADLLPSDAVVANLNSDGSIWAMHLTGRRFLDPAGWPLGEDEGLCQRGAIAHLADPTWPDATRRLQATGARHLFLSDLKPPGATNAFTRAQIDQDPRFRELLRGRDASVYEIIW